MIRCRLPGSSKRALLLPIPEPPASARHECMKLSPHQIRAIAVEAMCDPRSVTKAIEGHQLAPLTLERIRAALSRMGRADLLAHPPPSPTAPEAA